MPLSAIAGILYEKHFPGADTVRPLNTIPGQKQVLALDNEHPLVINQPRWIAGVYTLIFSTRESIKDHLESKKIFSPPKDQPIIVVTFEKEHSIGSVIHDYTRLLYRLGMLIPMYYSRFSKEMIELNELKKKDPKNGTFGYLALDIDTLSNNIRQTLDILNEITVRDHLVKASLVEQLEALLERLLTNSHHDTEQNPRAIPTKT